MSRNRKSWWSNVSIAGALAAASAGSMAWAAPAIAPAKLDTALLVVTVNGAGGGEPVLLLRGEGASLYAPEEALASWRLKPQDPAFVRDGKTYIELNRIPGIRLDIDEAQQLLRITVPPAQLQPVHLAYRDVDLGPMTSSAPGAFLNYEAVGGEADGVATLNGQIELGAFTRYGVGLASFVGRVGAGRAEAIRLETSWTIDDPDRLRSLRIGDAITRGGVGGTPLRFGGIQFGRNFAVQPGFLTLPLPTVGGSAALPSVVDVYVNNVLRDSRQVPPGPFEIANVPIVTGGGDVALVVRDMLGRETLVSQSYYAAPALLRAGLSDYSVEAGFLRNNFGIRSDDYGAAIFSGTERYGFSDAFTGELHVEASGTVQAAGVGGDLALPGIGAIQASVAGSSSSRGEGVEATFGLERRTPHLSYGFSAQFASDDYVSVGFLRNQRPPAWVIQAFAGIPLPFGSLGFSYLLRNGRTDPDAELLSASASVRLGRLGMLYLALRKNFRATKDEAAELMMVVPLGPRTSATGDVQVRNGSASLEALLQRSLPVGPGFGYRAEASLGGINRFDGRISLQTDFGTYDGELTWVDGRSGARLTAQGAIALVGGTLFASRELDQSFAAVKVGNYAGVRVYADNQLVGRTNASGVAVVPRLRPFDRNDIRIELADLPMDVEVTGPQQTVRPYDRSGVTVDFRAKRARAALARVVLEDGSTLPAGASIQLDGRSDEFVIAPGGQVYFTELGNDNAGLASWDGGSCRFRFHLPETNDPQPDLGDLKCQVVRP